MREEIHRNSPLIKGVRGLFENPLQSRIKKRARELRKQGVLSEVLLWNQLKYRKMRG
jgi:very-short-patch-repair endonuclease